MARRRNTSNFRRIPASKPVLRLDTTPPRRKPAVLAKLIDKGHVMRCSSCNGLSAYAWCDTDESLNVAHIGAASCWEWQCGHCRTHWVEADSPINSPCYTHAED